MNRKRNGKGKEPKIQTQLKLTQPKTQQPGLARSPLPVGPTEGSPSSFPGPNSPPRSACQCGPRKLPLDPAPHGPSARPSSPRPAAASPASQPSALSPLSRAERASPADPWAPLGSFFPSTAQQTRHAAVILVAEFAGLPTPDPHAKAAATLQKGPEPLFFPPAPPPLTLAAPPHHAAPPHRASCFAVAVPPYCAPALASHRNGFASLP